MSKDRYSDNYTIEVLQNNTFGVSSENVNISESDITLDASNTINLDSSGNISLDSDADLILTALSSVDISSTLGGTVNIAAASSLDLGAVTNIGLTTILGEVSITSTNFTLNSNEVICGDITCDSINIGSGGGNEAIDWSDVSPETDINLQPVGNDILLETDDGTINLKAHEKSLGLYSYNSGIKLNQDSSNGQIQILSQGSVEIVAVDLSAGLYSKESRYSGTRSKVWCDEEYAAIQGAAQSSNHDSGLPQERATIYVGREGYPRVLVETDFEGDSNGADKWVMSINNHSSYDNTYTGGEKYILRLAMNESSPESNDNDPAHDGLSGWSDYYLRCVNSISSATDATGGVAYYIDANGNTPDSLTGQHWVVYEASGEEDRLNSNLYGMIAISSGKIFNTPKLDEALPVVKICRSTKDSRVYGVLTKPWRGYDMRQFLEFDKPYNEVSRGEVAPEKDESSYSINSLYYKARVNSVGEGQVWITNYGGEILNGDYITSSEITGYGMRQDDDILHSYTVAKCVETIDWNSVTDVIEHDGEEYKRYLSACTYHCG
jgi:hypothetical protein